MSARLDLMKLHKAEYATPKTPAFVNVARGKYLACDGEGAPNGPSFAEAVGALYGVAYTIKMRKKREGSDYGVAPLEALWWSADPGKPMPDAPADWRWKAVIRLPDFITLVDLELAVAELERKGRGEAARRVLLEELEEGDCVQMLHVGPYSAEPATIEAMNGFVAAHGRTLRGRHHEIYLSDPRRVPPERLRTILRLPVE